MKSQNPGCLGAVLRIFGTGKRVETEASFPYRIRDDFLSTAELSFFRLLCALARDSAVVCPKINLADVLFVARPNENQTYRNKIDRKHVDFLLCDPTSMQPLVGVELDDASHKRADRQTRDAFVDNVFKAAGLPLVRVPARSSYGKTELATLISPYLSRHDSTAPAMTQAMKTGQPTGETPMCPKCGVSMVLRTAARGDHKGGQFWGCANFPKCRETVLLAAELPTPP